jgi:phosphatidylglycerophosphate synthase
LRRRHRPLELVKHAVWLAVALIGTVYFALQLPRPSVWGVAGLTIGIAMLTVYVLEVWLPGGRDTPLTHRLGDLAVLLALVAACALLLVTLLAGLRQPNFGQVALAGLFLVTFGRILRDYVRHLRRRGARRGGR